MPWLMKSWTSLAFQLGSLIIICLNIQRQRRPTRRQRLRRQLHLHPPHLLKQMMVQEMQLNRQMRKEMVELMEKSQRPVKERNQKEMVIKLMELRNLKQKHQLKSNLKKRKIALKQPI